MMVMANAALMIYERTERSQIDETHPAFKLFKKVPEHDLNVVLREVGLKYNRNIDTDTKRWRLLIEQKIVTHDKFGNNVSAKNVWFYPTPFGRNWWEYWRHLTGGAITTAVIAVLLVALTYTIYHLAEAYHEQFGCRRLWRWGDPRCQVAKYARTFAETCIFRWNVALATVAGARILAWGSGLGGALINRQV